MKSVDDMATSYGNILSAIEPKILTNASNTPNLSNRSPDIDQNLNVVLDDRDLWLRFQNLTNEMIVTKNGRYVFNL